MSGGYANDYDNLKKALLTRYNFTEDHYRKQFREFKSETEETPIQFVICLKNYLAKWLELSGSSSGDFDTLVHLIVKEQFINACSEELAVYLLVPRYGHRQSECPTKVIPGKDQKSLVSFGQSNQKQTRTMVAKSHENGEEAFTEREET